MQALVLYLCETQLVIDRAHRIPKPTLLMDNTPWDVLERVHFYHAKEAILLASKKLMNLPEPYIGVKLFADISAIMIQNRKRLSQITAVFLHHGLYPFTHKGSSYVTAHFPGFCLGPNLIFTVTSFHMLIFVSSDLLLFKMFSANLRNSMANTDHSFPLAS